MDKIHALRALTLGAVLIGGAGLYLYVANRFVAELSGPCDPIPTTTASLLDYSVTLRGGERSIQKLTLAAHTSAMVFLIEQGGMDEVLEVFDASGKIQGRADSPIQRTGIQRVLLSNESANAAEYRVEALAKEEATLSGPFQLRTITLPNNAKRDACLNVQTQLAQADTTYAAGLVASTQIDTAPGETKPADAPAQFKAAADGYIKVAEQLATHPSLLLAQAQHAASAVLYDSLYNWQPARDWADRATSSYAQQQDEYGRARALAMSAAAQMEIALNLPAPENTDNAARPSSLALAKVREQLQALATFHQQRNEPYDQALNLNNLGLAYWYDDQNDQAINSYQQALPLYEALRESSRQAQALHNLGLAEYELGSITNAHQHYVQALRLPLSKRNFQYASLLTNKATTDMVLGQLDVATRLLNAALKILEAQQNTWGQTVPLMALGEAYEISGDYDRALQYYKQTLAIAQPDTAALQRAITLRRMARILRTQGNAAEALSHDLEAIRLEPKASIRTLLRIAIATDYDALKQYAFAESELRMAQDEANDVWSKSMLNLRRGQHYLLVNQPDKALQDLSTAQKLFKDNDDIEYEFYAQHSLAQAHHALGNTPAALQDLDHALMLAEQLRQQSANPAMRATQLQLARPAFDMKIQLLAGQHFSRKHSATSSGSALFEALQTAEQSRARALGDYQRLNTSHTDEKLLQQRQALLLQLTAQRRQLTQRLEAGSDSPLVNVLKREIINTRAALDQLDAQLAAQSGAGVSTHYEADQLQAVLKKLPVDTAVIEYWSGTERTLAWVLTRSSAQLFDLGSSQAITEATLNYHRALQQPDKPVSERMVLSKQLYDLLLRPLQAELDNRQQLIIAPDGALHYLPFATLLKQDGNDRRFLVQDHDISLTPALSLWADAAAAKPRTVNPANNSPCMQDPDASTNRVIERSRNAQAAERLVLGGAEGLSDRIPVAEWSRNIWSRSRVEVSRSVSAPVSESGNKCRRGNNSQMLLVADPVYQSSDERLAGSGQPTTRSASVLGLLTFRGGDNIDTLQRLPGTAREAAAITRLMGSQQVTLLKGLDATRERFLNSKLAEYRYIHIASHAFMDAEIPQLSSLVLSTRDAHGQSIEAQVTAADLVTASLNADVVVLSACETALGQNISGEGLMGLSYIMLARGARSVVASLWQVPDQASSQLMTRFYEHLLMKKEPVASALSAAMREMLATGATDPALWATFAVTVRNAKQIG